MHLLACKLIHAKALAMADIPRRVELAHTLNEDVLEDMADTCTTGQLRCWQLLAATIQHLAVAHRISIQQPQQQGPTAEHTCF